MAKDTQNKKRKASVPAADAEKPTKVKNVEKVSDSPLKKRKATEDAAPVKAKKSKTPAEPKSSKKAKTSDDAAEKDEGGVVAPAVSKKASIASKKANGVEKAKDTVVELPVPKGTKDKKAVKSKAQSAKTAPEPVKSDEEENGDDEIPLDAEEGDDDLEEDDQTLALIKGFESDGDDVENDEVFKDGQEIPKLPADALTMTKKQQKKLNKLAEAGTAEEPGVVYIGRIPHGFYENEMKAYFKQFGNILRLRVSRNKKTGASKHYAFIEFESGTVAEIVAKTMDSYLMFGHLLKVKLVPAAQVHKDLFKGANKRFKKVPWNKIEGRKLNQGASEDKWDQRVVREEQRRVEKAEKMMAIGYEFKTPKVKTTKEITKKEKAPLALTDEMEVDKSVAIETAPAVDESSKPTKKGKKAKPAAKEVKSTIADEPAKPEEVKVVEDVESAPVTEAITKSKKAKKAKVVKETVEVAEELQPEVAAEPAKPKEKKRKAEAAVEIPDTEAISDAPEKKLKKKKSKSILAIESEDAIPEVSAEKAKKPKKSKK